MHREWVFWSWDVPSVIMLPYLGYQQVLADVDFVWPFLGQMDGDGWLNQHLRRRCLAVLVIARCGERFVKGNYPRWLPGRIQWPFLAGRR